MIDYFIKKKRLLVLMYHRVLEQADPFRPGDPSADVFAMQMDVLKKYFNVLHINDAVDGLKNNSLPARAVTITFDDGYLDNFTLALPIMERAGLPFTIFVTTGYLNGRCMWNDAVIELVRNYQGDTIDIPGISLGTQRVRTTDQKILCVNKLLSDLKYIPLLERYARVEELSDSLGVKIPKNLMMSEDDLMKVSARGVEIGGHTVNHPILTKMNLDQAYQEILEGKQRLENLLDRAVDYFAYPNGKPGTDYNDQHVLFVRELGFKAAFTTEPAISTIKSNIYQIPRIGPWHDKKASFLVWLVKMFCR